jgi:signal transduction histidine kinase/ligand-binding sensor domain-containing protein
MTRAPNWGRWLLAVLATICLFECLHALDANRMPSQYVREQWNIEKGFPGGPVHAIAQTPDGYLWIGTDTGLLRFDGFNFSASPLRSSVVFSNIPVLGLISDADGNMWIRLQGTSVLRQRNGKLESVTSGLGRTLSQVTAILSATNGGVLLSDLSEGLLRFQGGKSEVLAQPTVLPGSAPVISMAVTPDGKIWMGTLGAGLFYFAQGRATSVGSGLVDRKINCLLPVGDHELWLGTDNGLFHWNGAALSRAGLPPSQADAQVLTMLRDRDSNVWVGTTRGLLRINAGGIAVSEERDLRGNGGVNALFEDREGNIWVGGARGLERIRDTAFVTYLPSAGLPSESNGPVYVDADNRTWFAPAEGGLYSLEDGRVQAIKWAQLDKDVIYSIAGSKEGLWIGRQHGGLTHLEYSHGSARGQSYTQGNGLAQNSVYAVYQSGDGAVWAGTLSGGVSRFKDGRFINYTTASGLASNTVTSILETRDRTMWFATSNGLSSLSSGRWKTYSAADGLPSENVNCLFEDSSGVLWAETSHGLAFLSSGHIEVPSNLPELLRGEIFSIAEDKNGWFWVATSSHVLRARRDRLVAGILGAADVREFGPEDGLRSVEGVKRNRSVVSDPLGRIWFSLSRGLSVVDPSHLTDNSAPAIAHVESISADGNPIDTGDLVRVPASPKRITFRYTGLSLAVPERVRFRYFLEGFDRSWSEPVANREAVYTNLGAGPYRFRVVASNSDGVWNSLESTLPFEIAPAFWQAWWFRLSVVLVIALAMLMFFRLRMLTLTKQMNMRFEERLSERTRIAQELHDTLLQGFLSASMQLHVANDQLAPDSPAKPFVGRVLEVMGRVIDEGRDAVRGLRSSKLSAPDLERAFSRIRQEFPVQSHVGFRVIVDGTPRPLRSIIRDEVYHIGHEALSNAFRHAHATDIEVELEYAAGHLRVLVRDNGSGIDAQVLRSGRDGHWGLSGMKERTERIGGRLRVLSRAVAGTEVELSVPGQIAFDSQSDGSAAGWLSRLYLGKRRNEKSQSGRGQAR